MKKYKVNDIFYTLQGEGYFTGTPAVFLRFSGCNRCCHFCDTEFKSFTELDSDQIIERIKGYPSRHIVVTGGEPLLQLDDELIDHLHLEGFFIQVETNGSLPVPEGVDWVTCSPKEPPLSINRVDELKVVYLGQDVEAVADSMPPAMHMFLQPCSGSNIPETVDYIKSNPHWRLSLQTHILINIP